MATALLDGIALERQVEWIERPGVQPVSQIFELRRDAADFLLATRTIEGSTLEITSENGNATSFGKLTILREAAASRPDRRALLVVDRRFLWPRIPVYRAYNVRKRSGNRRVANGSAANAQIVDVIDYAAWSLKGTRPWTAREIAEDLLAKVSGAFDTKSLFGSVPIQDLDLLLTNFAAAWLKLEAMLPGLGIKLLPAGDVVAYDKLSNAEERIAFEAMPRIQDTGWPEKVDLRFVRPSEVHVYFEREIEVRFDFESGVIVTTISAVPDARVGYNVLRCPDPTLDLPGAALPDGTKTEARTVARGTWIPALEAIAKWASEQHPIYKHAPFSEDTIRRAWFRDHLWRIFAATDVTENKTWLRRVAAIKADWRQAYQIPRRWVDRAKEIKPCLAATVDIATGTQAQALVFSDYAVQYGLRRTREDLKNESKLIDNVHGAPPSRSAKLTDPGVSHLQHATLDLEDADAGIVRIDYHLDPTTHAVAIIPSLVEDKDAGIGASSLPKADLAEKTQFLEQAVLSADHRLAIVLTLVPAAVGESALHREIVLPKDVEPVLKFDPGPCEGPPFAIMVTLIRARFGWLDELAPDVESAFGLGSGVADDATKKTLGINVRIPGDLTPGVLANEQEIRDVALAYAAQLYAQLIDRVEGVTTTPLASYPIDGTVGSIRHSVTREGRTLTTIEFPPERPRIDLAALMPAATARKIWRIPR